MPCGTEAQGLPLAVFAKDFGGPFEPWGPLGSPPWERFEPRYEELPLDPVWYEEEEPPLRCLPYSGVHELVIYPMLGEDLFGQLLLEW